MDESKRSNDIYSIEGSPSYLLENIGLTLQGRSRSAAQTGCMLKEVRIMFDAEIGAYSSPEIIMITHGHGDHCYHLPMILSGSKTKIPQTFAPDYISDKLVKLVNLTSELGSSGKEERPTKFPEGLIKGVKGGDKFKIRINKKKNYLVDVFDLDHTVPTVGYMISDIRKKLKAKFQELSKDEIKEIKTKDKSIELTELISVPLISFLCDTSIKGLEKALANGVNECPNTIVECTYLKKEHFEYSGKNKHIHWIDIKKIIINNPGKRFILIHFSQRYKNSDIQEFFSNEFANWEGDYNVLIWLDSGVISYQH